MWCLEFAFSLLDRKYSAPKGLCKLPVLPLTLLTDLLEQYELLTASSKFIHIRLEGQMPVFMGFK
jgi:hypothetical protein